MVGLSDIKGLFQLKQFMIIAKCIHADISIGEQTMQCL